jgi:NurA-like 5'-3' nuclease
LSKTSYSNVVLGGEMGDMFYFNRVSSHPGYSDPIPDRSGVSVSYIRLAECSPCVKLEVPVEVKDGEVEALLDVLSYTSVDGYPYVLRLAHKESKISHEDMEKLANLLGLNTEVGGRQVLGE